jgi:hypothetical protein
MIIATDFFKAKPTERDFGKFKSEFLACLHSKDKEMSAYRIEWGTIVVNIAIALTGVGVLLIFGKLIHSKVMENCALFFFQKRKTTSEEKISAVESAMNNIESSNLKTMY